MTFQNAKLSYSHRHFDGLTFQKGLAKEGTYNDDKRRYGVIETHRVNAETFHLLIDGQMWSEVEWSPSRQCWCIQDAAGECLAHAEHIVGQDRDVETAVRLAKRMIISGTMPAPEEAHQQLRQRLERDRLGEPWVPLEDKIPVKREP